MQRHPCVQRLGLRLGLGILLTLGLIGAACTRTEESDGGGEGGAETTETGPIKVGFFAPLTGPVAADGEAAKRGAELAVEVINGNGGVDGREIELIQYDDAFSPDEAANLTRRLVEQDDVVAVISGSYSTPTRAAAPIAEQAGVPFIASYAVDPTITEVGEHVWRIGALATVQGAVGAELVTEDLGAQRIAMLVIDNDFGAALASAFDQTAVAAGAEIVYQERYPLGESDFRALLDGLEQSDPDAIYAIGYYAEAASFVKQAQDAGIDAQIVGQEGYDSPSFLELAGDAAEGVIITTDLDRDSDRESVQQFLESFEAEYGTTADIVAASCYDAVQVLVQAIENAGGTTPDDILEGLAGIEGFDAAVTGPILSFTEGREVVRPIKAQQVQNGEFHSFANYDDPELITPPE